MATVLAAVVRSTGWNIISRDPLAGTVFTAIVVGTDLHFATASTHLANSETRRANSDCFRTVGNGTGILVKKGIDLGVDGELLRASRVTGIKKDGVWFLGVGIARH